MQQAVLQKLLASCMSGKMQERDDPRASSHSDAACPSGWYCFDDERVDPWDISNLAKDCFGGKYQLPDLGQGLLKPQVKALPDSLPYSFFAVQFY